jgi:hypothetical protein
MPRVSVMDAYIPLRPRLVPAEYFFQTPHTLKEIADYLGIHSNTNSEVYGEGSGHKKWYFKT